MIYILKGQEPFLSTKKIDEIISRHQDAQISRYNGSDKAFSINEMIEACTNIGLFAEKTLVLVRDPYFLMEKIPEKDAETLSAYCSNPAYENELILYTLDDSFNERLLTYKEVSSNAEVIRCDQLKNRDFSNACYEILKSRNMHLNREIASLLINTANNSLTVFNQDLDVISLYPGELNTDAVSALLTVGDFNDVYQLINALTAKKVSLSIKLMDRLLAQNGNVIGLVVLLANQLRYLYEVSYYDKQGDSKDEIMDKTNTKSKYRIEKALENLTYLKDSEILKLMDKLADLNYTLVSSSDIDQRLQFELFITSLTGEKHG